MATKLSRPFASWNDGLIALCDALADADREKIVAARVEATADHVALSPDDIVALALTASCSARFKSEEKRPRDIDPSIAELAKRLGQDAGFNQTITKVLEANDRIDDFVLSAFSESDPRRLLNDTKFGLPAAALADVSKQLGEADPFLRLARRLSLWFKSSWDFSRYGIACADGRPIRGAVRKLIDRISREQAPTTGRLLRIWAGEEEIECSREGIAEIWSIASELSASEMLGPLGILVAEICGALIEDEAEALDDEMLASLAFRSVLRPSGKVATSDLRAWIVNQKRYRLMFDPSSLFASVQYRDEADALVPLLIATLDAMHEAGHAVFPTGPFPIDAAIFASDTELFRELKERAPEAADAIRLLAKNHGDWVDSASGECWTAEYGTTLRDAIDGAGKRGDPAFCDILISCWLLYCGLFLRERLPDHFGLAGRINSLPIEQRRSTNAVLGYLQQAASTDRLLRRDLDALLSWLPPVPIAPAEDLAAEMRQNFSPEWDDLAAPEQRRLVDAEREFRSMRRPGLEDASKLSPTRLSGILSAWAAVSERLLFRAVCGVDESKRKLPNKERTLGHLAVTMSDLIKQSQRERWDWQDVRRGSLIDWNANQLLLQMNKVNTSGGKHIQDADPISWEAVVALHSRLYYGGVLKQLMRAARTTNGES